MLTRARTLTLWLACLLAVLFGPNPASGFFAPQWQPAPGQTLANPLPYQGNPATAAAQAVGYAFDPLGLAPVNCEERYEGPKPKYEANPAHTPGMPGFNPRKTIEPGDTADVFSTAVPGDATDPRAWFGLNADGQIYRFSVDNNNIAHFSGIDGVGDGIRNITPYARCRLEKLRCCR